MLQGFKRFIAGAALVLMVLLGSATAQAQSNWLPSYDQSTHVYVDPALKNHASYPLDFSSMQKELDKLSAQHQLQVYIVAIERDFPPDQIIAKEIANDLVARWQGKANFPNNDFLLIVWVRRADNPNKGSVAAYGGNKLVGYGYSAQMMSDKINGPVTPALKRYMPQDPQNALLQIVRNINNGVDQRIAAAKQAEQDRIEAAKRQEQDRIEAAQRAEREKVERERQAKANAEYTASLLSYLFYGTTAAGLIGLLIFLTIRFRRAKSRAQELLEQNRTAVQNAGHWYVELEEAYFGFLKRQQDWQNKFKGSTAKQFKDAISWYADLTVRKLAASELFDRAETNFNSARFPFTGKFQNCIKILTQDEVVFSGKDLSIEEAELFKGLSTEIKCSPTELLIDMEELFKKTNKALSSIKKAFEGAAQNRKTIAEFLAQVEALQDELSKAGLNFDPYKPRFDKIAADRDAALKLLDSDPLAAFDDTQKVEEAAGHLKNDMERAIAIKGSLKAVENELKKAQARAAQERQRKVGYGFPDNKPAPDGLTENFLFVEAGGNPDQALKEAAEHLQSAYDAVLASELDKADAEKSACLASSKSAIATIEAVLASKASVEKQVPALKENLARLDKEIPQGGSDVDSLKADFLAKNFAGQPEKLERAMKVSQATDAELSKVRSAYFEQRFLDASKLVQALGRDIQGSRNELVEISSRLNQLRDLRAHAKKVLAESDDFAAALKAKLTTNTFTSSKSTDESYSRVLPKLRTQKADVAKAVTDWPSASDAADKLSAELKSIDQKIDEEKRAYELAGQRIEAVATAVADANALIANPDTREPARRKFEDARSLVAELDNAYKQAKSDWNALARQAESQKNVAQEARRLAEEDHKLATQARQEIDNADSRIRSISTRSFVQTVSWGGYSRVISLGTILDLGEANRHLHEASSKLQSRDYEAALTAAARASAAADSAEQWANAQLAAMAQEMIQQWQAEERRKEEERRRKEEEEDRRRREEQRRQQEEEDRRREEQRRRDDSSSSSSGNYGSGGSNYDSGGSGGSNYDSGSSGGGGAGGDNY